MNEKWLSEKKIFNDTSKYQDIMNVPYHSSKRHLAMDQLDRAAQFAPFGALDGFSGLIKEKTNRYSLKKYLNHVQENRIEQQLKYLLVHVKKVDVNYFNDDSGYYEHIKGCLEDISWEKGRVSFDGISIVILNIREIRLLDK